MDIFIWLIDEFFMVISVIRSRLKTCRIAKKLTFKKFRETAFFAPPKIKRLPKGSLFSIEIKEIIC